MSPRPIPLKIALLCAALALARPGAPAEVCVLGNCSGTVDAQGFMRSLGTRRGCTYQSARDQVLVTVCNTASPQSVWRVDVKRGEGDWPEGVKLRVRRTGPGIGGGQVWGATGFQEVGTSYRTLLTGVGDRTAIPLQFQLTGISLDVPVGLHTTSLVYTVIEIGG